MKKIVLLSCLLSSLSFANGNTTNTENQLSTALNAVGNCLYSNIPSPSTLLVDGTADALLRQIETLAVIIKKLESKNPVNGAIVRDFTKELTVLYKAYQELPVDLSGRRYDVSDIYAQTTKLFSKICGFLGLWAVGQIDSGIALFLVNNGGDVLSQAVLDAGNDWRKSKDKRTFEEFVLEKYSVRNSIVSIPAKGTVSYLMGWIMQKASIVEATELFALTVLNQVTPTAFMGQPLSLVGMRGVSWKNKLPFRVGFPVSLVMAVVKSLILTTTAKSAVSGVNYALGNFDFSKLDVRHWFATDASEQKDKEL